MALRSSWDGYLRLSLISIPVRAYNAATPQRGEIRFNQVHKGCGERIRYQKVCPVHGEVTKDDIVSGYPYEKGQYVEIERGEIERLRAEGDETVSIDVFVPPEAVDPIFLSGKTFYLVPSGPAGQKPFALMRRIMTDKTRWAVGTVVLSGHEEVVLIRPAGQLLAMSVLFYESQVKSPEAFEEEVGEPELSAQEVKLAGSLVDAATADEFDFSRFKDRYTERVAELIEAKLAGKELPRRRKEKAPAVINLMDALRESLRETEKGRKPAPRGKRKTG